MSTAATSLQIETATENRPLQAGEDPMAMRWGINCAVRDKYVDGDRAGFAILPFGKFFPIARFQTPEEIHSVDEAMAREQMVTKTAKSVELYLGDMLAGRTVHGDPDPQKDDWGLRFAFNGDEDAAKMAVLSATLLPSLPSIHTIAANLEIASPILEKCPGEDAVDFSARETCPSCWLEWIASDCCDAYIQSIATSGREVQIFDTVTGTTQKRTIAPSLEEFQTARAVVIDSLRHGLVSGQKLWRTVALEMEKGERKDADIYQNNIRKDVHADRPADAQLRQVREYARVAGQQPTTDNSAMLNALAQSQLDTQSLLRQVIAGSLKGADGDFTIGDPVMLNGEAGVIKEAKSAGWFTVETASGIHNARKGDLSKGG